MLVNIMDFNIMSTGQGHLRTNTPVLVNIKDFSIMPTAHGHLRTDTPRLVH